MIKSYSIISIGVCFPIKILLTKFFLIENENAAD